MYGEATGAAAPGLPQNRDSTDFIETYSFLKSRKISFVFVVIRYNNNNEISQPKFVVMARDRAILIAPGPHNCQSGRGYVSLSFLLLILRCSVHRPRF
jgi:hypothetical protein